MTAIEKSQNSFFEKGLYFFLGKSTWPDSQKNGGGQFQQNRQNVCLQNM